MHGQEQWGKTTRGRRGERCRERAWHRLTGRRVAAVTAGGGREGEPLTDDAAIVQRFYERLMQGDEAGAQELVTPSYHDHTRRFGAGTGRDAVEALLKAVERTLPGVGVTIEDIFAADGRVCVRWTVHTMSAIEGLSGDRAPISGALRFAGLSMYRIEGGKIAERWMALSM